MIPKIIHLCWISGEAYPPMVQRCIESWEKQLPDYKIMIWDRDKANAINRQWVSQSVEKRKYAFAADYIRLHALYHFGGIYLDADVEVIKPFGSLLNHKMFIGLDYNGYFEPAIIGAEPQHRWIGQLLEYYNDRPFVLPNGNCDIRPLPDIFGESGLKDFDFSPSGEVQPINNGEIIIYPYDFFPPNSEYFRTIKTTANTFTIHHFEGSWVNKGWKFHLKNAVHRSLIRLGGRQFHQNAVQQYRNWITHSR